MKLLITSVANAGDIERERVILRAREDINLTHYAVFMCRSGERGFRAGDIPRAYWFFSKEVKQGDYIVLYTKVGERREKIMKEGPSSYFYYWRQDQSIWTPDKRAVVVNTPQWRSADPQPSDEDVEL